MYLKIDSQLVLIISKKAVCLSGNSYSEFPAASAVSQSWF